MVLFFRRFPFLLLLAAGLSAVPCSAQQYLGQQQGSSSSRVPGMAPGQSIPAPQLRVPPVRVPQALV